MSTISEKQQRARQEAAKEAICEAALELISQADFEGLKMKEIASAVGIATGTLYNYFKNKEDLLYYVDRRLHERIRVVIEKISQKNGPSDKRLRELVDAIFKFIDRYHVVFDLARRSGVPDKTPQKDKQRSFRQTLGYFENIFTDGIEQGCFRSIDVHRTSMVLLQTLIGVCKAHDYLNEHDFSRSKRAVLGMFEDYLKAV